MKVLRNIGVLFSTLIIVLVVQQFFFCPRFNFPQPEPFAGPNLYNPYANTNPANWQKANLHAHSDAWHGLTNGHGTAQDISTAYDSLGYAYHAVSEYHRINEFNQNQANYVPAYEHGYNIKKTHYLVIGGKTVSWLDYIFPQAIWNKQWMINKLSQDPERLVIMNHPAVRNGFKEADLKYLSGYRCMEVLNPAARSFFQWDVALSAGKPVFIVGNDDIHNVFKTSSLGRFCTVVNVDTPTKNNLLTALRSGNSYGVSIPRMENETLSQKAKRLKEIPQLLSLTVANDTVAVSMNKIAKEIVFIGKNGAELAKTANKAKATYTISTEDEYVRTEAHFEDGTSLYLNPVFRYHQTPFQGPEASINQLATSAFFLLGLLLLGGCTAAIYLILPYRIGKWPIKSPRRSVIWTTPTR